jgi:hypothetical protein
MKPLPVNMYVLGGVMNNIQKKSFLILTFAMSLALTNLHAALMTGQGSSSANNNFSNQTNTTTGNFSTPSDEQRYQENKDMDHHESPNSVRDYNNNTRTGTTNTENVPYVPSPK